MTNVEIQALEALCIAARGKYGTLVDLNRVPVSIKASTLDALCKQGFIGTAGQGHFTITMHGMNKAIENRNVPPADG